MNNIINPYSSSRTHIQERAKSTGEAEEELNPAESNKIDSSKVLGNGADIHTNKKEQVEESESNQIQPTSKVQEVDETASAKFINTLEGAIERKDDISLSNEQKNAPSILPGLTVDEQQMIYRYFPESPNLDLRLYKQDMSTNKVTPGSVGSRVDLRG